MIKNPPTLQELREAGLKVNAKIAAVARIDRQMESRFCVPSSGIDRIFSSISFEYPGFSVFVKSGFDVATAKGRYDKPMRDYYTKKLFDIGVIVREIESEWDSFDTIRDQFNGSYDLFLTKC